MAVISTIKERQVLVWDPLVRIGHWIIVAGFTVAYFIEDDLLSVHVWAGYIVGAAVTIRVIWGFVGPRHARFADFLFGPSTILSYMVDLLRLRSKRFIGHSPAGAAMVFTLLICLAGTVVTGLALYGAEKKAGPLRALYAVAAPISSGVINSAAADENGHEGREGIEGGEGGAMKEYHEVLANITLALIILHILGILWASFAHRENLIWAMVTGRKRANGSS
jgi:cytochrome b